MLFVESKLLTDYFNTTDKESFNNEFNKRIYTVKNTSLSYRQANSMENDGMLPIDKDRKNKWRKFTLKELFYISIVLELKKFGVSNYQLRKIFKLFFFDADKSSVGISIASYSTETLLETFIYIIKGEQMFLTLTETGSASILQAKMYPTYYPTNPHLIVDLNNIMNRVRKSVGLPKYLKTSSLEESGTFLSEKESIALEAIRNSDYINLKLTKKDGDIRVIHAELIRESTHKFDKEEILKIIEEKEYQDIYLTRRDGIIVRVVQEETIKV